MDVEAAEKALFEWSVGSNALALLRASHASGVFDALRSPLTPAEVAGRCDIATEQAQRICMSLESLQIVVREDSTYRLTEGWARLGADDQPARLGDRLVATVPLGRAIDACFERAVGFEAVAEEEAVALACSVWGLASSPAALRSWAELDAAMPELRAVWEAGARHAEFGCGAGRDLLRVVVMYPRVSAVGYELLPHVMESARRLASALGVEDRVEFRCEDVLKAPVLGEFDTIMWSQMFFGEASRPAALAAIKRALKPGGLVVMPLMPDLPRPEAIDPALPTRALMLLSVAYPRWNIHWPRSSDVREEMEREGFLHLHTVPHPRTPFMLVQLGK